MTNDKVTNDERNEQIPNDKSVSVQRACQAPALAEIGVSLLKQLGNIIDGQRGLFRLKSMTTGMRGSTLIFFFVLGMAFMGAMVLYWRPDLGGHEKARIITEPGKTKLATYTKVEQYPIQQVVTRPVPFREVSPSTEKNEVRESQKPEPVPDFVELERSIPYSADGHKSIYPPFRSDSAVIIRSRSELPVSVIDLSAGKSLRGRVFLDGIPPPPQTKSVEDAFCSEWLGNEVKSQTYIVGPEGELKDVVVLVNDQRFHRRWPIPADPHVIRVEKCRFEPHVSVMRMGQRLMIENRDLTQLTAHLMRSNVIDAKIGVFPNTLMEIPVGIPSHYFELPFATIFGEREWMFAYVTFVAHPYFAVTDADGKFEIRGLPEGKYRVRAQHRRAGVVEKEVEIGNEGGEVEFRIELKRK